MKAYEACGCTLEDVRYSLTFCFVNAWYAYWQHQQNNTNYSKFSSKIYLDGAIHYLDLMNRDSR